jgi:hypothetical protein
MRYNFVSFTVIGMALKWTLLNDFKAYYEFQMNNRAEGGFLSCLGISSYTSLRKTLRLRSVTGRMLRK